MQELEPTWQHTLSVWWLIIWRGFAGGMPLAGLAGFIIGFVGAIMHLPMDTLRLGATISGVVIGSIWWIVVVRMALRKQYGKFRIALVPNAQIKETTADYDRGKLPPGY